MRLKVKSKAYLKRHEDRGVGTTVKMRKLGGRIVTVSVNKLNADAYIVEEDPNSYWWEPWMFENFTVKERLANKKIELDLKEEIQGNNYFEVDKKGSITIGCTVVKFKTVEHIYKEALKRRKAK